MSLILVLATLAAALPQLHEQAATTAPDTDVVETRSDDSDRMTVPVRIGTAGPYRFVLDTGAQNTVVSRELAQRLALPVSGSTLLMGVAGTVRAQTVQLDEIALGRRSYYALTAPLLEGAHIGADGIVGVDGLQDQRVLLDFRRNLVAIGDARTTGGNADYEIVVTAKRRSGQLVIASAHLDGVKVAMVIDTGADTSIGNSALLRALGRRGAAPIATELTSVTGQTLAAQLIVARRLDVQGLAISNLAIAFADAPPFAQLGLDERPALLLGMQAMRLFPRIAIDFPARRILFDLPDDAALAKPPDTATRLRSPRR